MSNSKFPAVTDIKYHFAWHTINRTPILVEHIRARLMDLLRQSCNELKISIIAGGGVGKSHVHMMLHCPAIHAPSEIVRKLKGRSSRLLHSEFDELKRDEFKGVVWNPGYYCATIGDESNDAVREYLLG